MSPTVQETAQEPSHREPSLHHLDAIGHACPIPVLMAVRDMLKLYPGDVLELVGDDPGIAEDIPAWAEMNGHELLLVEQEEGRVVCRVKKGETDDPLTWGPVEEDFFDREPGTDSAENSEA